MIRLCKRAKVKYFDFHAIRHLTASVLFESGYPLRHIQMVLRHKNPSTTEKYLRRLGYDPEIRNTLESGLQVPAKLIAFAKPADEQKKASEIGSF